MFDYLTGTIASKHGDAASLDVGGVGYSCFVSVNTLADLPPAGDQVTLLVHLVVREDELSLYGFLTAIERELFRRLISVSGVGPKVALALLSGTTPEVLLEAIGNRDIARLRGIKGVGPKTAERIIVDLTDYAARRRLAAAPSATSGPAASGTVLDEAVAALVALGFVEKAAIKAVQKALARNRDAPVEDIVREALGGA